jgi:hypothetical protein
MFYGQRKYGFKIPFLTFYFLFMKKIFFILPFMLIFACIFNFTACKKEIVIPPSLRVCMKYAMTQCADPWGYQTGQADSVTIAAYFQSHSINANYNHIVRVDPGMVCTACTCTNGKTLYVEAAAQDTNKLKLIGFVVCSSNITQNLPNSLTGNWDYVWLWGGIGGFSESMANEHKWVNFSTTGTATFYTNATQTAQVGYTIVPKDPSFIGDAGISYTPAIGSIMSQNFIISNDSLWLCDVVSDGLVFTLKRR